MTKPRCRICTANDEEALIEDMAAAMWNVAADPPWSEASDYWKRQMVAHARAVLARLRSDQFAR